MEQEVKVLVEQELEVDVDVTEEESESDLTQSFTYVTLIFKNFDHWLAKRLDALQPSFDEELIFESKGSMPLLELLEFQSIQKSFWHHTDGDIIYMMPSKDLVEETMDVFKNLKVRHIKREVVDALDAQLFEIGLFKNQYSPGVVPLLANTFELFAEGVCYVIASATANF